VNCRKLKKFHASLVNYKNSTYSTANVRIFDAATVIDERHIGSDGLHLSSSGNAALSAAVNGIISHFGL